MDTVIVTRHTALVELLVERQLVAPGVPVIKHAREIDVEDRHVIGVLPLRLAARAACVTEIPLVLSEEQRGRELSLDELRQVAGSAVTYRVQVIPTPAGPIAGPVAWTWNDGLGSRSRRPRCLVVDPVGGIHKFTGVDVPGVVRVLGQDYQKNGKWSNSTYRCASPAGSVPIAWMQDWGTGETWPQDSYDAAFAWVAAKAPHADRASFEAYIRAAWPKYAAKWDESAAVLAAFGE
jgi:hypothetical protein